MNQTQRSHSQLLMLVKKRVNELFSFIYSLDGDCDNSDIFSLVDINKTLSLKISLFETCLVIMEETKLLCSSDTDYVHFQV